MTYTANKMTYSELFEYSKNKLHSAGIDEAESDVKLLFYYLLNADRSFLFMHANDELPEENEKKFLDALNLRMTRIPLQHITGRQNFMGIEFYVSEDVLIPRFDTETLVEEAMLVCADGDKVLDVCTGSGCILLSLMRYKNGIRGKACDISEAALNIARKNADYVFEEIKDAGSLAGINTDDLCKPEFVHSDLFENINDSDFDVIVSNPPYIKTEVIDTLMPEVKEHDPMLALDGGEDGLVFYRRIIDEARDYLRTGGHILVEIGNDQGEEVSELFRQNGYIEIKVIKDLAGNDRVVRAKFTGR